MPVWMRSVLQFSQGARSGGRSFVVAGEDPPVGPLGLQGAVEAFNFAVRPGGSGLDEFKLHCPKLSDGPRERVADLRRRTRSERTRLIAEVDKPKNAAACSNTPAAVTPFVSMDLGVGEATVVIDHGVDIVEPDLLVAGSVIAAGLVRSARQPPPFGMRAELLYVNMDHLGNMK